MNKLLDANKEWIEETWKKIEVKLRRNSILCKNKIPSVTIDGIYDDCSTPKKIGHWTNGYWPGIMWLMYAATKEDCFKESAEYAEEALDMALENYGCLHHDVGFMWFLSSGADYMLTGNEKSKNRTLHAAASLASRYNVNGGFIKAWNGDDVQGWVIIDSMLNIPLLYWAADITGNIAFKQIAMNHADKCLQHIRPDGSVYHVREYDIHTGEFLGMTQFTQGYDPITSSWSRGQAWAIYGFAQSYIYTGEERYLDAAKRVAHYFIAAICNDGYIPKSDFRAPEEPVYVDTSAGAAAACGLIEIAKAVPEFEKKLYMNGALNIMKALVENECDWSEEEQSILQRSSACYGKQVHRSWIYGEYYFVEAMYKLKGFEPILW